MEFKRINNKEEIEGTFGLYVSSFPEYERRGKDGHVEVLDNSFFVGNEIIDKGKIVGLLYYWKFSNYLFVEHFAIFATIRGKNYGSRALQKLIDGSSGRLIILEIEPPIDEITEKRLRFYERLGFVMNDYYYEHPSFDKVRPHVHELRLMSYPRLIDEDELLIFCNDMKNTVLI